jgi:hypothetical protein
MAGHLPRLLAIAGIEGRLSAAGLVFGKIDLVADALEYVGHGHTHSGEELIYNAGDE